MQWTDEGIVLGVKRHGETSVILELMTHERGRHLGLVRGGAGTRLRGVLQPGNSLRAPPRSLLRASSLISWPSLALVLTLSHARQPGLPRISSMYLRGRVERSPGLPARSITTN
jgi:hypothetical protein